MIMKKTIKTGLFFVLGFGGGLLALHLFSFGYIEKFLLEGRSDLAPIQLIEEREVIIKENEAIVEEVERIQRAIIGVKSSTLEGSGVIVSSDGLVVVPAELVPTGSSFSFHINGDVVPYEIRKRDLANNLALVKVEGRDLPTLEFADIERVKLGERVFLVGAIFNDRGGVIKSVNEGIIKRIESRFIRTNIFDDKILVGSALFDIRGRLLGINLIESSGEVKTIPISTIREFVGL